MAQATATFERGVNGANVLTTDDGSGAGSTSTETFWLDNIIAGATSYPAPSDVSPRQLDAHYVTGAGLW